MRRSKKTTPATAVTLGLLQHACGVDAAANLRHTLALAARAAGEGAQIICTQELFRSPYFCQSEDYRNFALAEPVPGPSTRAFQRLARKHGVVIVASLFERRAAGVYHNTAAVIDADGSLLGTYRKMHIPDDPLYYEKFYFTPGDTGGDSRLWVGRELARRRPGLSSSPGGRDQDRALRSPKGCSDLGMRSDTGFRAWSTRYGKIGVLICWDQWFPEAARLTALQGAEILFYPTAIGWHPREKATLGAKQHSAWEMIQRSHAVANGCFVASVNRIGHEAPAGGDGLEFWGQSFVAGTSGELLAKAGADREEILLATVDRAQIDDTRTHWPFLRDRRVDAYGDLTRRIVD